MRGFRRLELKPRSTGMLDLETTHANLWTFVYQHYQFPLSLSLKKKKYHQEKTILSFNFLILIFFKIK